MKYFVTARLSENIHETPEGFLVCVGVPIARTGEMIYGPGESPIKVGPDGKAIVTREAKELFRPETIASFEGKAFTIKHPEDFVNPGNWRLLAKGVLQNVRRGSGANESDMLADVLVTDHEAIALVKQGLREVSCGYEAEYVELGIGRGMQTNIIGNHLALVEQGRAGAAYAINDQKGAKMKNLGEKIKGIFAKAGDEAAKVVDDSSTETPPAKTDDAPKWAKDLETSMKKFTDAISAVASGPSPTKYGDEEKEDKEKKKADDAEGEGGEKKKDAMDEAPAWAKDMMKCMNSLAEKFGKADDAEGEEEEESEDAEGEEEEASEDDDFEETPAGSSPAADQASRIEILAPGLKAKGKDAKRAALAKAYEAKDTKAIIDRLNGGKAVDLKKASQKTIDHLFIGASEVVGLYRTKNFTKWKQVRDSQDEGGSSEAMTPEKINEINKKHYANGEKGVH